MSGGIPYGAWFLRGRPLLDVLAERSIPPRAFQKRLDALAGGHHRGRMGRTILAAALDLYGVRYDLSDLELRTVDGPGPLVSPTGTAH